MFRRRAKVFVASPGDDAAATERLKAVTGRGKGEESLYPIVEEQPKASGIRRLFWNPDEIFATPQ